MIRGISMRLISLFAVLVVLLLGSGCSVQLPGSGQPPRVFVLSPKSTFAEDLPEVDWQLLVSVPTASSGIASSRIALRHNAMELEYYGGATWTDNAPRMVQTLLIESFENTGRIVSVGRQAIGLRSTYMLKTDLREFQAEYFDPGGKKRPEGAAPIVRVRMNAKLVKMPERIIVGSRTVEYFQESDNTDMTAVVSAFDTALGKTLRRIVEWSLREGETLYNG